MQIEPIAGTRGCERGDPAWWRRFGVYWSQDWSGVLFPRRHNWSDFTLIRLQGELTWNMGTSELNIALLGFHVQFTYYWPSDNREDLKRTVRLFQSGLLETEPLEVAAPAAQEPQG